MISALTIAGSDPSGGAGIQQDLRVFQALGVAGLSAITAITVQNSQGVRSVHPVSADVLAAQIEAVMEDATDLRAVKIGMLGGAEQVRVVAHMIRRFRPPNVVLDPVLTSSGGVPLLDDAGRKALISELLPLCDLVTPNTPETAILSGLPRVTTDEQVFQAGRILLNAGGKAVLVKGGHRDSRANDYLFTATTPEPVEFYGQIVDTVDTHGTGCFLASAVAGYLALGDPLVLAVNRAKYLLENGLRAPIIAGRGTGYPDARTGIFGQRRSHRSRLSKLRGLYVLTDPDVRSERSLVEIAQSAFAGGASTVQLRNKNVPTPVLIAQAKQIQEIARTSDGLFIVNDRVDVALASRADGVHLGPDDIDPRTARRLLGPDKIIGVSVSSVEEAARLAPYASYIAVGAIFGSATKSDAGEAIGIDRIGEIRVAFPKHPLVAIGGINLGNIDAVIAAGADAVAVISAVVCAPDMTAATRELCSHFPAVNPPVEEQ